MADEDKQDQQPTTDTAPENTQENKGERTFTQAELDQIVKERLGKERKKYEDYDALKDKAGKFDEIEAANKTELEKAQEEARKATQEVEQVKAEAEKTKREARVVSEASKLNFADPQDAVRLIGEAEDVAEALKQLAEEKPYLLKADKSTTKAPKLKANNPGGNGEPEKETDEQRRNRLYGGGNSVFDAAAAPQLGGGVMPLTVKDEAE